MNNIVTLITDNAHLLVSKENDIPITKYNPYLIKVLQLCYENKHLMGEIPSEDAGDVGIAFYHILSLTDEEDFIVYPTYSSISFYYLQKHLNQKDVYRNSVDDIKILDKMIRLMNIGARSFCRTIAKSFGLVPADYINFSNWKELPEYVKNVLLLEYSYFVEMKHQMENDSMFQFLSLGLSTDSSNRYNFLLNCVHSGYFKNITNEVTAITKANDIKEIVYRYVNEKITTGDILFN